MKNTNNSWQHGIWSTTFSRQVLKYSPCGQQVVFLSCVGWQLTQPPQPGGSCCPDRQLGEAVRLGCWLHSFSRGGEARESISEIIVIDAVLHGDCYHIGPTLWCRAAPSAVRSWSEPGQGYSCSVGDSNGRILLREKGNAVSASLE